MKLDKLYVFAFFAAFALSGAAYATPGNSNGPGQGNGSCVGNCAGGGTTIINNQGGAGGSASIVDNSKTYNTNTNLNSNTNVNTQGQKQGQMQGQSQGQSQSASSDQSQSQSQSANNAGNTQQTNVTVESTKQAVSGPGIASSPSATCRIAVGLSVGGTFGGVGAFGSIEDERCADMERGRYMAEVLGRRDAAHNLACQDEKMAKALGDCPGTKAAAAPAAVAAPVAPAGRDPFRYSGY